MITKKYLEACKKDFMHEYKDLLCEESIDDIQAASNIEQFIAVLKKYMVFVGMKPYPTTEWVRHWFKSEIETINHHGVYLDQAVCLTNPQEKMIFFGNCGATITFAQPKRWDIMLYGHSMLNIVARGVCEVVVRQKDQSYAQVAFKDDASRVKIHKI